MSSSNINEPFVLSSYTSSVRGKSTEKYTPGVYATSNRKAKGSDAFVTVAVQADGVHVLDVSALHPVISHTLGPSTSFTCPPLSLPSSSSHSSKTYAIISSSPELSSPEEAGRTLWVWQDDTTSAKQKQKQSRLILPEGQAAYGLYSCDVISGRIIALTTTGDVSVIDADSLEIKSSFSSELSSLIYASVFPAHGSFLATEENAALLVTVSSGSSKTTHLRILAIDEADSISRKEECKISVDSEKIASISCSQGGVLSFLTIEGVWSSYQLSTGLSSSPTELSAAIHLSGFSQSSKHSASLLSLSSSHVLLAFITSGEVTLLLWDLRFPVLLSSHTLPVPSTLSSSSLHIRLVAGIQTPTKSETQIIGQAILILSSIPSKGTSENKTVSVLLVVPYTVPTLSTIAAALGRGGAAKKWLREPEEQLLKQGTEADARGNMLDTMRTAMQGSQPQAAVATFMKWAPKKDGEIPVTGLDYNFVKDLLNTVLFISASATGYIPDVVRYLLEQRVVCSAMVSTPGGLLGALRAKDDWTSIELAFDSVLDLTESEIVECLRATIRHHRHAVTAPTPDDNMQVDTPALAKTNTVTPLPKFLHLLVNYPTSKDSLLLAFRRNMRDAEDLTAMLQVLDGWVARKIKVDERLMPTKKDLKKTEQGVWVVVGRKSDKKKKEDIPSLQKIVELIQITLDSSFVSLLQHPPAHKFLKRLQEQVEPEITFANALETLRGRLEPFTIAQEKTLKESLVTPQEKEREKQKGDWRQRRKGVALDVGLYKLEELVL